MKEYRSKGLSGAGLQHAVYGTLVSRGFYIPVHEGSSSSKAVRRAQHGNVLSRFSKRSNRRGGTLDKFTTAAGAS